MSTLQAQLQDIARDTVAAVQSAVRAELERALGRFQDNRKGAGTRPVQASRQLERSLADLAQTLVRARRVWKLRRARREFERIYLAFVLDRCDGDRVEAARLLGISRSSFNYKRRADYSAGQ